MTCPNCGPLADTLHELESTAGQAEEKGAWRLAGICRRAIAQIERLRVGRQKGGKARWATLSAAERSAAARHAVNTRYGRS
jgi:hypothetical protein